MYQELLQYAGNAGVHKMILDTPSVAYESHKFYEKAGFRKIDASELPMSYAYPDRNSQLYLLNL